MGVAGNKREGGKRQGGGPDLAKGRQIRYPYGGIDVLSMPHLLLLHCLLLLSSYPDQIGGPLLMEL